MPEYTCPVANSIPGPWYAIMNAMIGTLVFVILSALGIHYSGALSVLLIHLFQSLAGILTRYSDYFPMQDSRSYDNTGHKYNVSRILNSNIEFSEDLYKAYSPLFLSSTLALAYGISFASIAAVIVHTAL
jgi:hypothetical protein